MNHRSKGCQSCGSGAPVTFRSIRARQQTTQCATVTVTGDEDDPDPPEDDPTPPGDDDGIDLRTAALIGGAGIAAAWAATRGNEP